jgi:hypothetical protein
MAASEGVGNLAVVSNPSLLSNCHALIACKRRTSARHSIKEARTRACTHHPAVNVILFLDTHINRLAHNVVRAARLTAIVPRPTVRSCLHHDPPFPWLEQCHFHPRDRTARHDLTWFRLLRCDWSCSKRAHTDSGWEEMGYQPPLFVESWMRMTGLLLEYVARRPNVIFISDERLLHLTRSRVSHASSYTSSFSRTTVCMHSLLGDSGMYWLAGRCASSCRADTLDLLLQRMIYDSTTPGLVFDGCPIRWFAPACGDTLFGITRTSRLRQ